MALKQNIHFYDVRCEWTQQEGRHDIRRGYGIEIAIRVHAKEEFIIIIRSHLSSI